MDAKLVDILLKDANNHLQIMMPNIKTFNFVEYGFEFIKIMDFLENQLGGQVFNEMRSIFCEPENTRQSNLTERPIIDFWDDSFMETFTNATQGEHFKFMMIHLPFHPQVDKFFFKECLEAIIYYILDYQFVRGFTPIYQEMQAYSCKPNWLE